MPEESPFYKPSGYMEDAMEFIASEITSENVEKELRKMSNVFPWIDDDSAPTYFELTMSSVPEYMEDVELIASKTYTRGLVIISIYYDRCVYFLLQAGEGDQPLLDVRFPDVSKHGQGLHISAYGENDYGWKKLTLWHIISDSTDNSTLKKRELPKIKTINISTKNYEQTYCIMKSAWDTKSNTLSVHHDALFRFGSWCYAGRVQLTAQIGLHDVPFVIPALRMQQSRLDYYCDVNSVPLTSPFAGALDYMKRITPLIEGHVLRSEDTLKALIDRLSTMGLGESVAKWLEGDSANSFFEFKLSAQPELTQQLGNMEMIVSKIYYASGIVMIHILFQLTVYVCVMEAQGENPLLDSRFPDVSGKGRGYQLEAFGDGAEDWSELRKVSIWQTIGALEQEFREKTATLAQAKRLSDDEEEDLSAAIRESHKEAGGNDEKMSSVVLKKADSKLVNDSVDINTIIDDISNDNPETDRSGAANNNNSSSNNIRAALLLDSKADEKPSSSSAAPAAAVVDVKASAKTLSSDNLTAVAGAKDSPSKLSSLGDGSNLLGGGGRLRQALPHHLPKMESLGAKLDDIRKNMGDTVRFLLFL